MNTFLKGFLIASVLLFALPVVFAGVTLVSPVPVTLPNGGSTDLGSIQPGETLELFFSLRDGKGGFWSDAELDSGSLPDGWTLTGPERFAESLGFKVLVNPDERERVVPLVFRFWKTASAGELAPSESVTVVLLVRNDLVSFQVVSENDRIRLGDEAVFVFRAVNESLAPHSFEVSSSLANFEFRPFSVSLSGVNSDSAVFEQQLVVAPKVYGKRDFSFRVVSKENHRVLEQFNHSLIVEPTLRGKFQSGLFGFPVLAPSLNMFYFLNALVSFLG